MYFSIITGIIFYIDFVKRNIAFIGVVLGTLVLLIGGVFLFTKNTPSTSETVNTGLLVSKDAVVTGGIANGTHLPANSSALVTIVEFGDYQCPACGAYNSIVTKLLTDFSGKLNFVFRDFAFVGPESTKAAEATYCAKDQGKYWEFHDYLYSHQNGENKGNFSDSNLKAFAQELGLDVKSFTSCLDSNKYQSLVDSSSGDAKLLGIDSTPTFYLNNVKIVNPNTYDDFKQLVEKVLNANP